MKIKRERTYKDWKICSLCQSKLEITKEDLVYRPAGIFKKAN